MLLFRKKCEYCRTKIETDALGGKFMAKDPVCGMYVDEKKATKANYNGKAHYFCSATCQSAFEKNPKQFAK